jgi:hypothetical protein
VTAATTAGAYADRVDGHGVPSATLRQCVVYEPRPTE